MRRIFRSFAAFSMRRIIRVRKSPRAKQRDIKARLHTGTAPTEVLTTAALMDTVLTVTVPTAARKTRMTIIAPNADAAIPILTIRYVPAVWTSQAS